MSPAGKNQVKNWMGFELISVAGWRWGYLMWEANTRVEQGKPCFGRKEMAHSVPPAPALIGVPELNE